MPSPAIRSHRVLPDNAKSAIAKANVRKADIGLIPEENGSMKAIGGAVRGAVSMVGWSLKEVAAKCDVDEREVAKWFAGERRPNFDRLFAIQELRRPLVICLAALADGTVTTRIDFHEAVTA